MTTIVQLLDEHPSDLHVLWLFINSSSVVTGPGPAPDAVERILFSHGWYVVPPSEDRIQRWDHPEFVGLPTRIYDAVYSVYYKLGGKRFVVPR